MNKLFFSMLLLSIAFTANAETHSVKDGTVEWVAVGNPGFLKIEGEGGEVKGKIKIESGKASGKLTCELANFDTGMDLRNKHMKEKYLEVEKYPTAKLTLDPTLVTKGSPFSWSGKLTIKGETKPVTGEATVKNRQLNATFKVNIKDYPSIGVPSWLGVTVADTVDVTVEFKY